jgi:hypothetical protein
MRRSQVLGGAVAVLLLAGAAVALQDNTPNGDAALPRSAPATTGIAPAADMAAASEVRAGASVSGGASVANQPAVAPSQPRVVKTARLTISLAKAASVTKAAQRANTIAESHGGFVARTDTSTGENASSTLTLRIPVAAYDAALGELRELGKVSNETLGGEDVTNTLVDLEARLRSLRAQESALNTLMAKATTVGETLQVAQAVAEVHTQVEQLAAQQKNLADQADFATITLGLVGPHGAIGEPKPDPLLVRAFERAAGGSLEVIGGAIVVLGYALPAALLAAAGYGLARLRRRRTPAVL